ncbi:hypothetical protein SLS56_003359 [Neofusicoccum ribis]|uniref:Acyltransferase 3 domain-containing protein n=1 Tax=Neofusicoccum ribis TaxID=45134 RepID=A0ABR3T061_9PEZI
MERPLLPQTKESVRSATQIPSTTWINGVRGIASVIIALNHYLYGDFAAPWLGFGSSPENRHLHQLPFIRVIWCGHGMRPIFFIISGYYACWSAIRSRDSSLEKMVTSLSSSAFRRGLRSYLPVFFMATLSQVVLFCGLYNWDWSETTSLKPWTSPGDHLKYLLSYLVDITNPVYITHNPGLNLQYWVMPIEYAGSLASYMTVLALARVKPRLRPGFLAASILPFLYRANCFTYTFLCGVLIAELNLACARGALRVSPLLNRILFLLGSFLICLPDNYADTPGYSWLVGLESLTAWGEEAPHNWRSVAGVLFVFGICNETKLQRLPNSRTPQYLAKISWEIYLVHITLYYMWMKPIRGFIMSLLERAPVGEFWMGHIVSGILMAAIVHWFAKRLKIINGRLMTFAKRIEEWAQDTAST